MTVKLHDVGKYFTTNGDDIWKLLWFSEEPMAELLNLSTGEKVRGSIYSLNLAPFKRVIPEGEGNIQRQE